MEQTVFLTNIKEEIKSCFAGLNNIRRVILFGSYAYGSPRKDSDLDLVVILNQKGFAKSRRERWNRSIGISKLLYPLRKQYPIDVLVYTLDEWNKLIELDSSNIREIKANGIILL